MNIQEEVLDRFLRYVQIDTQSDPKSTQFPSTEKQKNLGRILVKELKAMGVVDAEMDHYGYVYATVPSNSDKDVPVICYCSHMDTSPDYSGREVKPIVHKNYQGQDIVLPDDSAQVIRLSEHPDLQDQFGSDIVTASGKTLLGADNKAGIAEIMTTVSYLMSHPERRHGDIRILFTPDEEIGKGADHVDLEKLGAQFGYTVDGERLGSYEDETFSANGVEITIWGNPAHPGLAKGTLENALKIASLVLTKLPTTTLAPELTEGREGFIHPVRMQGNAEKVSIQWIIRDFETEKLAAYEQILQDILTEVLLDFPKSRGELVVKEQYRNMKEILDQHPRVIAFIEEAMKRADITPIKHSIRGGTDGSKLSFMGLPCPNIFAGEHAFHSPLEWVSVQDMEKAVETLVHLAEVWEEHSSSEELA